jgi:hypothetical protein
MTKVRVSELEEVYENEDTPKEESESNYDEPPPPIEIPEVKPKRTRTKKQEPTEGNETAIKKGKIIACNVCGKELLEKTFKYYHQLKCKPKEEVQPEPPTPIPKPESFTVSFDFPRRLPRAEKYVKLIAKAF